MTLYLRFMGCLAVGLVGIGMVLTVLLERLFADWDVFHELGELLLNGWSHKQALSSDRAEDMLMEAERSRAAQGAPVRLIDQRRQQLVELASVEQRLRGPKGPIVLTPLPRPRAAGDVETLPGGPR